MIEKITENLNVIGELPDKPTISSTELKRKFDFSGNIIKNFINEKLIPTLENFFSKKGGTVEGNLVVNGDATITGKTKLSNVTASGNIETAGNITGKDINSTNMKTQKLDVTTINAIGDITGANIKGKKATVESIVSSGDINAQGTVKSKNNEVITTAGGTITGSLNVTGGLNSGGKRVYTTSGGYIEGNVTVGGVFKVGNYTPPKIYTGSSGIDYMGDKLSEGEIYLQYK